MQIAETVEMVHKNSAEKGFWDGPQNIGEKLMLIVSEAAEALEADRKDHYVENPYLTAKDVLSIGDDAAFKSAFELAVKNSFEDELADVVIRVFDLCGAKCINIEAHILAKHRYNQMRAHKHGKKY